MNSNLNYERFQVILDTLCLVMTADGRASRSERKRIQELMERMQAPWSSDDINSKIDEFLIGLDSAKFKKSLNAVCQKVPNLLKPHDCEVLLKCIGSVAAADGKVHDLEVKVKDRIVSALKKAQSIKSNQESARKSNEEHGHKPLNVNSASPSSDATGGNTHDSHDWSETFRPLARITRNRSGVGCFRLLALFGVFGGLFIILDDQWYWAFVVLFGGGFLVQLLRPPPWPDCPACGRGFTRLGPYCPNCGGKFDVEATAKQAFCSECPLRMSIGLLSKAPVRNALFRVKDRSELVPISYCTHCRARLGGESVLEKD